MPGPGPDGFNLSTVLATVARAVPDQEVLVWRDRRLTYAGLDARVDGLAHAWVEHGLGCHAERDRLAVVRVDVVERSPAGKADYRWARTRATSAGAARA